ncbi:hypothetical protein Tco_0229765, partial [Tanacetum coccineum]
VKSVSGASKPVPKSIPRNHSALPAKREKARSVKEHLRNLNKKNRVDSRLNVKCLVSVSNSNAICDACHECLASVNHDNCLVMCDDSVNVKTHPTKRIPR